MYAIFRSGACHNCKHCVSKALAKSDTSFRSSILQTRLFNKHATVLNNRSECVHRGIELVAIIKYPHANARQTYVPTDPCCDTRMQCDELLSESTEGKDSDARYGNFFS